MMFVNMFDLAFFLEYNYNKQFMFMVSILNYIWLKYLMQVLYNLKALKVVFSVNSFRNYHYNFQYVACRISLFFRKIHLDQD